MENSETKIKKGTHFVLVSDSAFFEEGDVVKFDHYDTDLDGFNFYKKIGAKSDDMSYCIFEDRVKRKNKAR